jgi:hypothetical protein
VVYEEKCRLRDRLIALTPYYPEAIGLADIRMLLQVRYNQHLDPQMIARYLKKAIQMGYLSHLGERRYTRPRTSQEAVEARCWEKPKPTRHNKRTNAERARQLQEANAAIRAQLLKGTKTPYIP